MVKRSKKYREAAEKVDRNNLYTANEAIALLKSMPAYNFDQTVEAVYRLSVDPRKADQLVRGTVNLPHGTGKTAKVAVFARGPKATEDHHLYDEPRRPGRSGGSRLINANRLNLHRGLPARAGSLLAVFRFPTRLPSFATLDSQRGQSKPPAAGGAVSL